MRLDAKLGKLFDRSLRHQGGVEAGDHDEPIVFIAFLDISPGPWHASTGGGRAGW